MRAQPVAAAQNRRIVAGLPFVEALARRMAASMPNSIDIGDLVQDGVLGLIDAAHRFDEDARHQVRDLCRAPRSRRDDRRAAPRCLAARRPPPAARARRGARGAASRAGTRAVDGRPGRPRRLRREASEPHDRPHQHDRGDVAAGDRRTLRRKLPADRAGAVRAGRARHGLREGRDARARPRGDSVAAGRASRK